MRNDVRCYKTIRMTYEVNKWVNSIHLAYIFTSVYIYYMEHIKHVLYTFEYIEKILSNIRFKVSSG